MTLLLPTIPASRAALRRWKGLEFDRLTETDWFDGQRVELVDGQILERPPMNDPHAQAVQLTNYALLAIFPPNIATIRVQCPMRLGESRPFPDLVVVAGTPREVIRHPETAMLVIEVSDTSLEFDRLDKARLYAAHGLAEYWIVNLPGKCVEIFRNPIGAGSADPRYGQVQIVPASGSLSPLAAPASMLRVADLLP